MEWLKIPNINVYAVIGILLFFAAGEVILGHYSNDQRDKTDWTLELIGFFVVARTKTIQVLTIVLISIALLPQFSSSLQGWSLWVAISFYLLIDDIPQYWYHRSAHEYDWLWKYYRVHHAAQDI